MKTQTVYLAGAKSFGTYGGYETFINKLTEYHQDDTRLKYYVACKANGADYMDETKLDGVRDVVRNEKGKTVSFTYHNACCFKIWVPEKLGSVQAIYYDIKALALFCRHIKKNHIENPIVYIMACRIGPAMRIFYKKIHKLGGRVYLNPDGHEWKRRKWSLPVRMYWRISERLMVKWTDLVVCDNRNIETYIHKSYDGKCAGGRDPKTTFVAYGAESRKSLLADDDPSLTEWYQRSRIKPQEYYLIVGRFTPENNYKVMLQEFMRSKTRKDLVIITNVNKRFWRKLERQLQFCSDSRIKFVGTVYDQELLMKIRENAWGYLHGHEVGGTNPSLLEALGTTDINLVLDVIFNREVAGDTALYWGKKEGELAALIDRADRLDEEKRAQLGLLAKERVREFYSWRYISDQYLKVFLG